MRNELHLEHDENLVFIKSKSDSNPSLAIIDYYSKLLAKTLGLVICCSLINNGHVTVTINRCTYSALDIDQAWSDIQEWD